MGYKMTKPEMFNGSSFVNSKSPSIELSGPLNLRNTYDEAYDELSDEKKAEYRGKGKEGEGAGRKAFTKKATAWNNDPKNKTKTAKYKREQAAKNKGTKSVDLNKPFQKDVNSPTNPKPGDLKVNPDLMNKKTKNTGTGGKKDYGKENYKDEDYKRTVDADGTKGSYKEKRQKDKAVNLDNKIEKKANKLKTLNSDTEAGGKKFNKKGKKRNAAGRVGNWLKRGLTKGSKKRTENRADKLRGKIDARDDADMKSKLGETSTTKSQVDGKGKKASTKTEKKTSDAVANNNKHNAIMGSLSELSS